MFKRFQKIIGSYSQNSTNSLSSQDSNELVSRQGKDVPVEKAELIWQQGNLQEAINYYDREIKENPHSIEPYQQLFIHLKQQNGVAEAYKKLAVSLKEQGKNDEAANCYRQAIVIQAVTKEAAAKYKKDSLALQLATTPKIPALTIDAFSFQGQIKEIDLQNKSNMLQIELPQEYKPDLAFTAKNPVLTNGQNASVEWEAAQNFMQKALDSSDREDWAEVANACEQATLVIPNMAEAYKIWGNALQRMNRTAEAMECYGKAVEIQPDLAEVYAGIAGLYAQQQKWQPAIEYYQKAIIIKPDFARAYRNLACVWEQSGDVENAKICNRRAREIESKQSELSATENNSNDPKLNSAQKIITEPPEETTDNSILTYQKLGQDSEQKHLWHDAAVYYRKALELNLSQLSQVPKLASKAEETTNQIAQLQTLQRLINSAQIKATDREVLAPIVDSLTANNNRTNNVLDLEDSLDKAIEQYSQKAKLKPNSASIQIRLGDLYLKKRKWQSAIACYNKAIRIDPQKAEAHQKLAKTLLKTDDRSGYVEHLYLAYTLKPDMGSAEDHFILGEALQKSGNRTRAIACYEQAIKLQPYFNEAYRCLGKVFRDSGKIKNAIACYQTAVSHNPQDADFHFNLGKLQEQNNSWENAVKAYRRVLELNPQYPQASQRLNHALSEKLKQNLAVRSQR